jgi:hypothetical protein
MRFQVHSFKPLQDRGREICRYARVLAGYLIEFGQSKMG